MSFLSYCDRIRSSPRSSLTTINFSFPALKHRTRSRLYTPPVSFVWPASKNQGDSEPGALEDMAPRYTEAEKEKNHLNEDQERKVMRIKAPNLDNSALIQDNALTLIGRLTNPQEQRMWALIPALPRKWNLQGRVVGSDLGNHCFQFRFEKEEDLRRVLENRPYHFSYWMIILQRWEPIISSSFPSLIPFWIRIKSLPLHFWHEDMIVKVGQELGTLENHELTKSTARVRVLVDGLKPLLWSPLSSLTQGRRVSSPWNTRDLSHTAPTDTRYFI